MAVIRKIPIPICGVILGMFSLGNMLGTYSEIVRVICGIIGTVLGMLFIISVAADFDKFRQGLKNPVMASVFGTFPMALMLFSTYLLPYSGQTAAEAVWIIAIGLHIFMIIFFTARFAVKHDIKTVFASWYIIYVGIVMASMTAPAFQAASFGMAAFWFGFAALIILLVIVNIRYVRIPAPDPAKPLFCITAAPVSICIAGYIQSAPVKSLLFLQVLWIAAAILTALAFINFIKLFRKPFYPSNAAYTFPFIISAIASKQLLAYSVLAGSPMTFLQPVALVETVIATFATLYALVRYLVFLFGRKS